MSLSLLLTWACSLLAGCGEVVDRPPSVAELQAAYDRQAQVDSALHDSSLRILGTDCAKAEQAYFYFCEIGYHTSRQVGDRVYLDQALFFRDKRGDWALLNGLCRRAGGPAG
jgi:hypothetical protein